MARHIRSPLELRSRRLALPIRKKAHAGPRLLDGVSLHYRRNQGNGTWTAKVRGADGRYWIRAIGQADDYAAADGTDILSFFQASDAAKALVKPGDNSAPITVNDAFASYERDLESRGARIYVNVGWPRSHLTPGMLSRVVADLTARELRGWRDGFAKEVSSSSVNRLGNAVCAALEHAAKLDSRISNQSAWRYGLAGIENATKARNDVLDDATIGRLVAAAYASDPGFGLFVHALAATGARASQLSRIRVGDFRDGAKPVLRVPKSGKGGGKQRAQRKVETIPVPIGEAFAAKLRAAVAGKPAGALLLTRTDGRGWGPNPTTAFRDRWIATVKSIGLPGITSYCMRHSSITRQLLRGVPTRVCAHQHDTSVSQIEAHYGKHIAEFADDVARVAVLEV